MKADIQCCLFKCQFRRSSISFLSGVPAVFDSVTSDSVIPDFYQAVMASKPEVILSIENLEENVQSVIQVMRTNVQRVLIREAQLDELNQRASVLSESASSFQLQAKELRDTHADHFKKNVRGALLLLSPILLFLVILWCEF